MKSFWKHLEATYFYGGPCALDLEVEVKVTGPYQCQALIAYNTETVKPVIKLRGMAANALFPNISS